MNPMASMIIFPYFSILDMSLTISKMIKRFKEARNNTNSTIYKFIKVFGGSSSSALC